MTIGEFIGVLLHSGTVTHIMHLQTRSFAAHKALNEYYDGITGIVDALAETYQGKYGLISDYTIGSDEVAGSPTAYVSMLKDFVAEGRKALPQDSELQNQVDEIAALINSTLYKLTFLS